MKKIAFLVLGIVLAFAILALPTGSVPADMKRIVHEAALDLESSIKKVYQELRSLISDLVVKI